MVDHETLEAKRTLCVVLSVKHEFKLRPRGSVHLQILAEEVATTVCILAGMKLPLLLDLCEAEFTDTATRTASRPISLNGRV